MPKVEINGVNFHYEDDDLTNRQAGVETIWIQHGVGRSSKFWQHWVPPLATEYRVIRRDQRGHGQSCFPGANFDWSIEDLLIDMLGFLDELGLESVHYIGESMGAVLGVAFAHRWPERLKSLTVCSMPVDLRPPKSNALTVGYKDSAQAKRDLGVTGWAEKMIEQRVISAGQSSEYLNWAMKEISKTPLEVLVGIGLPLYSPEANVAETFRTLKVPTLILAPTNSPITTIDDQNWIKDSIPDSTIALIDGPTHEIYVDKPIECIEEVRNFLSRLPKK
jgi:pimeloyl-ACP methyl ester carboxylesterase